MKKILEKTKCLSKEWLVRIVDKSVEWILVRISIGLAVAALLIGIGYSHDDAVKFIEKIRTGNLLSKAKNTDYSASKIISKKDIFQQTPQKIEGKWTIYPEVGVDDQKRYAQFVFVVLSNNFIWPADQYKIVELEAKILDKKQFLFLIFKTELNHIIKKSHKIIVVGTASQEGDRYKESQLARRRANVLADWMKSGIPKTMPVHRLSLGKHKKVCNDCSISQTAYQRPVVIVCLLAFQKDVNLGQALANAMIRYRDLPHPENYLEFDFDY